MDESRVNARGMESDQAMVRQRSTLPATWPLSKQVMAELHDIRVQRPI